MSISFIISSKKNAWGLFEARTTHYVAYFPTLSDACMYGEEVLTKAELNGPSKVRVSGVPYMVEKERLAFGMRK